MKARAERRWSFAMKVVAPVVITAALTIALFVGFLLQWSERFDHLALDIQQRIGSRVVASEIADMSGKHAENTGWDEAVFAVRNNDLEWINENLGVDGVETYGFDRAYVLKPDLTAMYAMWNGGKLDASVYAEDAEAVAPIVRRLTDIGGQAQIAAFNENIADAPVSTDFAVIDGRLAVVSAVPLLGATDAAWVEAKEAHFYVGIEYLAPPPAETSDISGTLSQGSYTVGDQTNPALVAVPVVTAEGQTLGHLTWKAERPAAQLTLDALPAFATVTVIIVILMLLLVLRLRRATTELQQAREQAVYLALHDPLTGLANRAMFQKRLTTALEQLNHSGTPIALLALDLDRFKQVNDTLGHEAGDELLRQVATRLKSLLDDHDAVARLGGDEFVVLQHAIKTVSEARHLSERIIEAIGVPFRLAENEVSVGVSIGVAIARDAGRDGLDLAARADFALYQAKESGRNTYRLYETDTAAAEPRREVDAA